MIRKDSGNVIWVVRDTHDTVDHTGDRSREYCTVETEKQRQRDFVKTYGTVFTVTRRLMTNEHGGLLSWRTVDGADKVSTIFKNLQYYSHVSIKENKKET